MMDTFIESTRSHTHASDSLVSPRVSTSISVPRQKPASKLEHFPRRDEPRGDPTIDYRALHSHAHRALNRRDVARKDDRQSSGDTMRESARLATARMREIARSL